MNATPEALSPEKLIKSAAHFIHSASTDISYEYIVGEELANQGYEGTYQVGRGSVRPPAVLKLDYNPGIRDAVITAAKNGLSYGAPTEIEIQMAEKICEIVPSIEKVRMVSSGTEATMSAIRLARGYTGKDKLLKFEGNYHGHADSLLVKAGSGALTLGEPTSPGVPADLAKHTLTADFNDLESVERLFVEHGHDIACIIVEPVAGNMNCVLPNEGFLQGLRKLCDQHEALLIIDEVMTGFRVALAGAQDYFGVTPDLTALGKVIGGGMPVGAFGGKQKIMDHLAPDGPVYQAGTLSGNPVAMAAGLTGLTELQRPGFHAELTAKTEALVAGLRAAAEANNIPMTFNQAGGMFGFFFTDVEKVTTFAEVCACDMPRFKAFFHGMLERGIYLAPSAFEAGFMSIAHSDEDIATTIKAAEVVLATL